jgi:hypothetical protein
MGIYNSNVNFDPATVFYAGLTGRMYAQSDPVVLNQGDASRWLVSCYVMYEMKIIKF